MKKICFLCLSLSRGGTERVISILANYFCRNDYCVTVIALENVPIDYAINKRIRYLCLNTTKRDLSKSFMKVGLLIRKAIKDADMVVAMNNPTICLVTIASLFLDIKKIYAERNDPFQYPINRFGRLFRNICFASADIGIFQTSMQRDYYCKHKRIPNYILYNPVTSNLPKHDVNNCKKIVISACRYDVQKNIKMTIDAFGLFSKTHEGFHLYIYGDGPLKNMLQEYVNATKLEDCIHLMDFTTSIHEKMANAMMFVSSSDHEGVSNSMIEAMTIGLPVICTDCPVGGAREEIINNVNGILVKVGDTYEMATKMSELADDLDLRMRISQKAREVGKLHNEDKICNEWHKAINGENVW